MNIKSLFSIVMMVLCGVYNSAAYEYDGLLLSNETFECNGLKYSKVVRVDGAVGLVGNTMGDSNSEYDRFEIPATVTDENGDECEVVWIGNSALSGLQVKHLVVPSTIRELGSCAFMYASLKKISFMPGGLKVVGPNVFQDALVPFEDNPTLELPEGVVAICNEGLHGCCAQTLILPSTLQYLGVRSLAGNVLVDRLVLKAVEPPAANEYMFGLDVTGPTNLWIEPLSPYKCVLAVPQESIDKYRAAPGWSLFTHIEAMTPEEAAGIAPPSPASERALVSVSSGRGFVAVTSPQAVDVRIIDVKGRVVAAASVNGSRSFSLPQGIYFVATPTQNLKVRVE